MKFSFSAIGVIAAILVTAVASQTKSPETKPAQQAATAQPAPAAGGKAPVVLPVSEAAPEDITKNIIAKVKTWTRDQFTVEGVRTTPIPGLYEIQIRTDLFYIDESGRYVIIEGEMIDMTNDANLTRMRMADVLAIDFKDLPLAKAIKQVNGDGKRIVALFEDPNCAYCRRLRADLMKVDNLTVYTFAYPILAADSDLKARKALCAPDTNKAWNELMLSGLVPGNDGKCQNALDEIIKLGRQYGVSATPTMFFPSGHRLQGYAPPTRFVELLENNQEPKG